MGKQFGLGSVVVVDGTVYGKVARMFVEQAHPAIELDVLERISVRPDHTFVFKPTVHKHTVYDVASVATSSIDVVDKYAIMPFAR